MEELNWVTEAESILITKGLDQEKHEEIMGIFVVINNRCDDDMRDKAVDILNKNSIFEDLKKKLENLLNNFGI